MFRERTREQDQENAEMFSILEKQLRRRDTELQLTKGELAKRVDELKSTEMVNAQAQGELLYLRRLVDDLNFRLHEAIDASKKDRLRANRMETASFTAAEDWKEELEAMQKQYQIEVSRLQKAKEDLKCEVAEETEAKEAALRMARDALLASKVATKQMETLSLELEKATASVAVSRQETLESRQALDELAKQKTDLAEAYAACQSSVQAGVAIVVEKEAELKKQTTALFQAKQQAELLRWELFESRKSETRLCEISNEVELLKKQLAIAKQVEEQQAKVVMNIDAKLQEACFEVQEARTAKNEAVTLLNSAQGELQENRQKCMLVSAEVSAVTANFDFLKTQLETQQMEIQMLQKRDAESRAKLGEASEKLETSLAREQKKDEALSHLACCLEEASFQSELLRQQIYEAVFEAQFKSDEVLSKSEVEITKELMSVDMVLKVAERISSKARADLQHILSELCSERELFGLGSSLRDFSSASAGLRTVIANNQKVMEEFLKTIEMDALPHDPLSLELALAACKLAALRIAIDLKVIREQLNRIREEAEMIVAVTSESNCYNQEALDQVRVEALMKTTKFKQLQEKFNLGNVLDAKAEVQGKTRELLEPWEIVDSGSEAIVTIKKEEYDALKDKVHEAMELRSLAEAQLLSLSSSNQRLSTQLDATNVEIKAQRLLEQSMFQQYDKLQQQNMILEAEMQRLKGKDELLLKSWEVGHGAYGLDASTLHTSQSVKIDRKLQDTSLPHTVWRSLSSSEKEEESTEFLSLSTKKKKKALYLRIGTFLTKKMN